MAKEHNHRRQADSRRSFGYNGLGFPTYVTPYSMVDNGCINSDQFGGAQPPVDAGSNDGGSGINATEPG